MDQQEIKKLASDWILNQRTFWAWEKLNDILTKSHDEAWPIIIEIVNQAESDATLALLAAGPLEDILCAYGDEYYDLVRKLAEGNQKFKRCLLMGMVLNGPGSDKIIKLIDYFRKEAAEKEKLSDQ